MTDFTSHPVLAIHYPGCVPEELLPILTQLRDLFPLHAASLDGTLCAEYRSAGVEECFRFAAVLDRPFSVVLVPGGDPGPLLHNHDLTRILRQAHDSGALIAAVCAGPLLLDPAGVLAGKTISHGYTADQIQWLRSRGHFHDCTLTNSPFTRDGKLFTAKPEAVSRLARSLRDCLTPR